MEKWTVQDDGDADFTGDCDVWIAGPTREGCGSIIAACFREYAPLIAAAPDLYEALDWALAEAEGRTRYSPDYYSAKEERENCINKCRAALRKATGEPA